MTDMKTEEALDKFMRLHEVLTENVTQLAEQVLKLARQVYELQEKVESLEKYGLTRN